MLQTTCHDSLFSEPQLSFSFTTGLPVHICLTNPFLPLVRFCSLCRQQPWLGGAGRGSPGHYSGFPRPWQGLPPPPLQAAPGDRKCECLERDKSSPYCVHGKVPEAGPGLAEPAAWALHQPPLRKPCRVRGLQHRLLLGDLGQVPFPLRPQFAPVLYKNKEEIMTIS